jgi:carboxypeptidase Q
MRRFAALACAIVLVLPAAAQAPEPVDTAAVRSIRQQGLQQSQVMDILAWLTDVHGPRLTGSPGLDQASQWAMGWLRDQGFQNVRQEAWGPFGRGWTLRRMSAMATGAATFPVIAYPKAWSPSVRGTADVVVFDPSTPEELEAFRGRLRGKIVLMETPRELTEPFTGYAQRHTDESLLGLANYAGDTAPTGGPQSPTNFLQQQRLQQQRMQLLLSEQPLALFDRNFKGEYGTVFVSGVSVPQPEGANMQNRASGWNPRGQTILPQFTLAVEHYNRLYRLAKRGLPVQVALDMEAAYNDDDPMEANVFAEIPGSDKADEVVMLGAHFDSWHAGTGTTDNAAGSSVMMEAMRILKETFAARGVRPRRTIRLALWTGEEQGLLGSRAYATEHFGTRGQDGTIQAKPAQEKVSGYFNMDNGTGKIRGVYLQGNGGVMPIFRAWLAPFRDLGAGTLTMQNTGGTDHLAFDAVGIPGFQFIQEPMAYSTRTHHSNMDVYDHAVADDLKQAATIIASFVYHTAMREERLPRKAMPVTTVGQQNGGTPARSGGR